MRLEWRLARTSALDALQYENTKRRCVRPTRRRKHLNGCGFNSLARPKQNANSSKRKPAKRISPQRRRKSARRILSSQRSTTRSIHSWQAAEVRAVLAEKVGNLLEFTEQAESTEFAALGHGRQELDDFSNRIDLLELSGFAGGRCREHVRQSACENEGRRRVAEPHCSPHTLGSCSRRAAVAVSVDVR
jgi:hypothetical protein